MRLQPVIFLTISLITLSVGFAQAAPITFQNTGNGSQVGGTVDPNWTWSNANPANGQAQVLDPTLANWWPEWVANSATSSWIGVAADNTQSGTTPVVFQSSFDLTGLDPLTAAINGLWAIDDNGTLAVNGHVIDTLAEPTSWTSLHAFSLLGSSGFLVNGVNTITISITSSDNFLEGVRFEATGTAREPGGVIPEPMTAALFALALLALVLVRRPQ